MGTLDCVCDVPERTVEGETVDGISEDYDVHVCDSLCGAGAEGPRPTQGIHMHIFETFNGFTVLILLLLAGAWLALLAYEGKL